mmetsp:Transcript_18612/g.33634  ORF Transcript_18612/g.33634 Transcript_18612/m.33634 type:complete len:189 (+) Transcript_18612:209-775(+)
MQQPPVPLYQLPQQDPSSLETFLPILTNARVIEANKKVKYWNCLLMALSLVVLAPVSWYFVATLLHKHNQYYIAIFILTVFLGVHACLCLQGIKMACSKCDSDKAKVYFNTMGLYIITWGLALTVMGQCILTTNTDSQFHRAIVHISDLLPWYSTSMLYALGLIVTWVSSKVCTYNSELEKVLEAVRS